jgi:hypothetical protein
VKIKPQFADFAKLRLKVTIIVLILATGYQLPAISFILKLARQIRQMADG